MENHNHGKSKWMMVLCMLPLVAFVVVRFSGFQFGSIGNYIPFMFFLLCPIIHGGMFYFIFKGAKGKKEGNAGDIEIENA